MGTTQEKNVVLVVDDDRELLEYIKALFLERGHEVATATEYYKAVRIARQMQGRSVVGFVDLGLPGKRSGIDLTSHLSRFSPSVAIYAMTGRPDQSIVREARWAGAIETLFKPLEEVDLFLCVDSPVARRLVSNTGFYDHLTGFLNRAAFFPLALQHFESARDRHDPEVLSMLFFDLNDFKSINDTYSHKLGDEALVLVTSIIRKHCRRLDLLCRMGGDELVALLPGASLEKAVLTSVSIQDDVASQDFRSKNGVRINLSLSCGVGSVRSDEVGQDPMVSLSRLIDFTDDGMYQAKKKRKEELAQL